MVKEDNRALLGDSTIFSGIESRDLDAVMSLAVRRRYRARQVVLRKGDPALQIFVIVSGRLKAITSGAEGREATLSIMGPGEVFGEVAVLDGEPRSATISALERCELLVIHRDDFFRYLQKSPRVAIKLLEVLARRLRRLSERVEDATFLEVPGRLAKQLLRLADKYGRNIGSGAVRIELKLSQQELGDLVGVTRESINKQLRGWVAEALVEHQDGRLVLLQVDALRELGDGT
ncbi:MAG: Crp/Fnr family transcriptional regulator [Deltaproteobacteria bacterium]|nr:MAG: Crp/Fnr family transcriptional regulator [Deltaproteobacteria bacterium]